MSYLRDIPNNLVSGNCLAPAARTATPTPTYVDLGEGEGVCVAVIHVGTTTDGTHTPSLEEHTASSGAGTAITPIDSFTAITSSVTAGTIYVIKFLRTKRYVRVNLTVTGSPSTGSVIGAWVGQQKKYFS